MPAFFSRLFVSLFIVAYILFSLQVSLFPGMKLPRLYLWPWTTWHMFQSNAVWNQGLYVRGYTAGGTALDLDLERMFEYIGGGHKPALLFYIRNLFSDIEKETAVKNRFCEYAANRHNRDVVHPAEKLVGMDLYSKIWNKSRDNAGNPFTLHLTHRWHE